MHNIVQKNIIDLIKRSQKILILPSSPPDGDSLGSAIALYIALRKLQKEVTVICSDPVPDVYDFLPNMKIVGSKLISSNDFIITLDCKKIKVDKIKSSIEDDKVNIIISPKEGHFSEGDISFNKGEIAYDLIITVDCAELQQLRKIYEDNIEMFHQIPVINIDHHISNTHFGKINHVDIMSSATTELLLPLFEELAKDMQVDLIDEDIATLLLTGIITDTGSFQNANTTPKSFEIASDLIAYGARQQEIIQYIYKTKQLSQLKLWGRVLSKIQTDERHRIVWSVVSQQDFRDTGSREDETGDIIDELMTNAPGAEIILLIKEKKDDSISVSMRSTTPSADVSNIAESFGGGGHTQAAGFQLSGVVLRDAEYQIIEDVKKYQSERLNLKAHTEPVNIIKPKEETEIVIHNKAQQHSSEPMVTTNAKPKSSKKEKKTKESTFSPKYPHADQNETAEKPETEPETEIHPGVSYKFED